MSIKNLVCISFIGWHSLVFAGEANTLGFTDNSAASISVENSSALTAEANQLPSQTAAPANQTRTLLQLPVVGTGKFTYLFWHIYNAKLMTQTGQFIDYQASSPMVLSLTYQRDISMIDFVDATLDQWQHIHGKVEPRHQQWAELLKNIWQDVKQGDNLSCQRLNNSQVEFYLNGQFIGEIKDSQFADEFLDIWLSEKTSAPELRRQLLK